MNKEMDNQCFNETNGHTGNSGLYSHAKPRLQPMRVQELLDMFSDDDDSEDKGKDSDCESEDDIQQLPEDEEESLECVVEDSEDTKNDIAEENKLKSLSISEKHIFSSVKEPPQSSENLEQKSRLPLQRKSFQASDSVRYSESSRSVENVSSNEPSKLPRISSANVESSIAITQVRSSVSSQGNTNRRSNVKFEKPETFFCNENSKYPADIVVKSDAIICPPESQESIEKSKYNIASVKSESIIYPSKVQSINSASSKFEGVESQNYYSIERNLPSGSHAQSELPSAAAPLLQAPTPSHLITDTPLKNNPPVGSSRPTPSLSHRSMFQTPQSSKINQDYAKNCSQTPATIFSHWSKNNMHLTPLQNRFTTNDSSRSQVPSILSQHGTNNDGHWYRNHEDKDRPRRKPLGEAVHLNQHSNDKSVPYTMENPSITNDSGDNENHVISESIKESSMKKPTILISHETKENRHPQQQIEKPLIQEEPSRNKAPDSMKELITACSNGSINEIRSESRPKVVNVPTSESQGVQSVRSSYKSRPSNATTASEKKNDGERKPNVQSSVPSSIRRPNHGETMTVKGKDYLILGTLGEGMSGQVLRVQDLKSRELRAIKIVDLSKMDKDCAQGCIQEISMLHKLQAPCVVRMFDYEIAFPIVHVVMEMGDTDFRSLLHSMSERKKLPLTMILYYWTEMLTAVKHIHDNGVIHSDLKPANFLLVRGRLKLIDFGIASSMNPEMTSVVKDSPIGTINYISPEALMDIGGGDSPNKVKYKITFKSDVWSLGCILYSLVYGHTPFQHIRQVWAKMQAIMSPNPNISFGLTSGNDAEQPPPVLIDVMRKCLQHDPKARPTVTQLLQIRYVPTRQNATPSADIPSDMLLKIKNALTETEWRQFTDIMESKRNQY